MSEELQKKTVLHKKECPMQLWQRRYKTYK